MPEALAASLAPVMACYTASGAVEGQGWLRSDECAVRRSPPRTAALKGKGEVRILDVSLAAPAVSVAYFSTKEPEQAAVLDLQQNLKN